MCERVSEVTINVLLHSVIKCHSRTRLAGVVYVCGLWKVKGRDVCVWCVCGEIRMSSRYKNKKCSIYRRTM